MTKAAIEEFLKERAKKEENKILLPKDEENQEINEDRSQDNDKSPTVITPQPMLLKTHPKDIWSARDLPRHQELSSSNQPPHNEVINLNLEDQPELVLKYGGERGESVRSNDKKRNTLEIETKSNHVTPLGSLQDGTNSRSQLRKNTNHNSIRSLKANPSAERGIIDIDLK